MAPEPWMRGPLEGIHPFLAPVLYSFQHAREDLDLHTAGLSPGQIWARPYGLAPAGFHIRHIGGSAVRLATYLDGQPLSSVQLAALKTEMEPGASREELLSELEAALDAATGRIRAVDPAALAEPRGVGRKQLPTTVIGLLVHIAEHTQRHTGQAIAAAKLVRAAGGV